MAHMFRERQCGVELGVGRAFGAELLQRGSVRLPASQLRRLALLGAMPMRQSMRERHLLRDEQQ